MLSGGRRYEDAVDIGRMTIRDISCGKELIGANVHIVYGHFRIRFGRLL
jgi:hypothetical protein